MATRLKSLPPSARPHLSAAEGWIGLGNLAEAASEFEEIAPRLRAHPDVLNVRYQIFGLAGKWDASLDIATTLTKLAPERFFSWGAKANSLRKLGRIKEGRDVLFSVVRKFKNEWAVHYELARFCCLLNRVEEGKFRDGEAVHTPVQPGMTVSEGLCLELHF